MPTTKKTGNTTAKRAAAMLNGVLKNIPVKSSLMLGGSSTTQPQMVTQLKTIVQTAQDVVDAKTAWQAKVASQKTGAPAAKELLDNLVMALKQQFGAANPLLASFGIALPKPRTSRTALERAASHAQTLNTRKARNIISAKERQSITTTGKPGVTVVGPTGQPLLTLAPVAPGSSAKPQVTLAADQSSADAGPASASTETPAQGTPAAATTVSRI